MLKIRITYADNNKGNEELTEAINILNKQFDVLNQSRAYAGRGNSIYSNIYVDVDIKTKRRQ